LGSVQDPAPQGSYTGVQIRWARATALLVSEKLKMAKPRFNCYTKLQDAIISWGTAGTVGYADTSCCCVPCSPVATSPQLDIRLSTRMAAAGCFCWSRALGRHGARGDGLCRHRRCSTYHGSLHNSPGTHCLCATWNIPSVGRRT